ncbi:MAG: cupin domain-containing protein [Acidobacteria bacterium]|nr:cupin domain-containing protein [Acidobacteriota bacterium]
MGHTCRKKRLPTSVKFIGLLAVVLPLAVSSKAHDTPKTLKTESFYENWIQSEGIPIYRGFHIDDVRTLQLKPWKRLGASGAYLVLDGMEGTDDAFLLEIAPNKKTLPERHLFEEVVYVVSGTGRMALWKEGRPKQFKDFQKGSLLSPPLNSWHEFYSVGNEPVRLFSVTSAPAVLDLFHNEDFVFNNNFEFTDRYNAEKSFFDTWEWFHYEGLEGVDPHDLQAVYTNFVPDVRKFELKLFPRGKDNSYGFLQMDDNVVAPHVAQWEVGVYSKAHRHGPGSVIIIIDGKGYSLVWTGSTHYSKGKPFKKVDWHEGSVFVPPLWWFHQHFNTNNGPSRYLAIGWVGRKWGINGLGTHTHQKPVTSLDEGGNQINYENEDPVIRTMYEEELKKAGVQIRMPAIVYQK